MGGHRRFTIVTLKYEELRMENLMYSVQLNRIVFPSRYKKVHVFDSLFK